MDGPGRGSVGTAPGRPAAAQRTIYLVDKPGAAQSEVRVGRVAVDRSTDATTIPLAVVNTVLGGSFTSRLNSKLREEKGYTYGAGSYFDMRRAPGPFEASAAVATPVTDSAVVEFVREIDRMHEEAVPAPELDRARNYLALRLPQRFESLDDVVGRLAELVLVRRPPRLLRRVRGGGGGRGRAGGARGRVRVPANGAGWPSWSPATAPRSRSRCAPWAWGPSWCWNHDAPSRVEG